MGLESLLKRDDIPFDVKETITKELHEIRRLQRELKKREEMYYSSVEDFKRTETALRESEEKYRNLIERANDGIAISQDYKLVFVNHRLAEILAYTVEELQGMPYNKTTHPDYTSEIDQRYEARLKGEETPSIYDTKLIRKDGTIVDVEFNSGAITYQGRPAAFTFIRDITERKKAEQALQQSEERLRAFIYSVTDSIDLWDSNLDLVDCNQAVIDKFPAGTKKEDLIGKNILEIIPDLKDSERYQKYLEVLRTGKPYSLESFESHPKFGKRIFSVQSFKVGDGLGMITRDITEQKLAENLSKELEERRDNFVWMTSHELRTPLTVIIGYIEFLENMINEIDYDSRKKIFQTINNNLKRLERLTDEVSLLAQLERGLFNLDKKAFNFCTFFQEAVEPYKNLLGDQIEVTGCSKEPPLIIEGDQSRLQQLLDNLLRNAINHTPSDQRLIRLALKRTPQMIQMIISDNGAGIASENLERIFDQFVSIETEYYASGTGLGLYLCRKIAEGHDGYIQAKSAGSGHGSSFVVGLPRKQVDF